MILTVRVNADATKYLPGSAMICTPSEAGKYWSKASLTTLAIYGIDKLYILYIYVYITKCFKNVMF